MHGGMSRTSQGAGKPSGGRARLLLVEDELSTVFAVREFFALAGYDVDCAAGFEESAALIERNGYHAVITDLHLTGRNAEGMLVVQCARRRNPNACIVMLTAYGSDATVEEAYRCGVDMYSTKPVDLRTLSAFLGGRIAGAHDTEPIDAWKPRCSIH